jgi:peptide/nickel transport system substrate-binding protein
MTSAPHDVQGMERREFLKRTVAAGAAFTLPTGLLTACGGEAARGPADVLSIGTTTWLPPNFFLESSLGLYLVGWTQIAWPLFIAKGNGFEYQGGVATDYQVSSDGRTHTVTIREGMKFHDGSPINADAVVANLRGAIFKDDPLHRGDSPYVHVLITLGEPPIVRSVEAVDARTVEISLTEYRADIKTALAFILILNPKILRKRNYGTSVEDIAKAGSGPFRLRRFRTGDFAELERFDGFHTEVRPARVRIQNYSDPGALALALKTGEIAVASGLAKADFDTLSESGFEPVISAPAVNVDLVFSHPKDPAFKDRRVRQAVAAATNREAYTDRFFSSGTATLSSQPVIPEGVPGYVDSLEPAPYDPERARALLAEAGVDAPRITLTAQSVYAPISSTRGLLEAIAQDMNQVGFRAEIEVLSSTAYGEALAEGKIEAMIEAPGGQPDPFILFDLFFGPGSTYAPGEQSAFPGIGRSLRRAHVSQDTAERDALLEQIITTTTEEALMVPISVVGYSALVAENVENFTLSATALDSWHPVTIGS